MNHLAQGTSIRPAALAVTIVLVDVRVLVLEVPFLGGSVVEAVPVGFTDVLEVHPVAVTIS